jgi:hypothetical protein
MVAFWFNVPALIAQVFLLVTFAVLPERVSGRHYLSIGLCCALVLMEVSVWFVCEEGIGCDGEVLIL